MNNNPLMRRADALDALGITEQEFTKLVHAELVTPVYLVWQVRDARGALVMETSEVKARAEAERINGTVEPLGRAYYRREEVVKLVPAAGPTR